MRSILMCSAVAAALSTSPALAETMTYKATLSPQSEVPPHPDLKGSGSVNATFDTASKKLSYTATYDGLTGNATMAHFHGPAPEGKNAGVLIPVSGAVVSPIEGSVTLTDAQAKDLADGMLYFNIHTDANKAGEIRGQVGRMD